jgi:phage-related baseplate assembly protein
MLFALADLVRPLTRQQVETSIYDVLGTLGVNTTTWKPGAVVRAMITATAVVLSAFSVLMAQIAQSGWLELAEGDWLTLVAWYVFQVERIPATFATGDVTLTNAGGGVFTLDVEDLIVKNLDTDAQYRNTAAFTLGANETITITVRATEAGAVGTSAPSTVTGFVTPLIGVTVTNPLAIVGMDEETDPALRARCLEKLGSLSPFGPWDAYAYAARTATRADGSIVGVTRVRSVKDGYGNVYTYVATPTGAVSGDVNDPATDLGAVNEAIQQRAAPLAVTAWVDSATPVAIDVSYSVWMYNTSGLTVAELVEMIATRLATFMSTQPIGGNIIGSDPGKVFNDAIRTVIESTRPEIFHAVVSVPAGDAVLLAQQVPVLGTVTAVSIVQQPPPQGGPS